MFIPFMFKTILNKCKFLPVNMILIIYKVEAAPAKLKSRGRCSTLYFFAG